MTDHTIWVLRCPDCEDRKYSEVYPPKDKAVCEACDRARGVSEL